MTLTGLAIRNALFRNKVRAFLTMMGVMIAALAFIFLRTLLIAWYADSEASSSDRVIVRNAISITQSLPLSQRERIAQIPGVTAITYSNWFGGIYKDRRNFFAQWAFDAASGLDVLGIRFVQGQRDDFLKDRNSCVVGRKLAERYGFKMGNIIPLQGDIYPGDWRFRVAGIVEAEDASISNTMFFHWQRLNEELPAGRKDQVGIYTVTVAHAQQSPQVIKAIDDTFANSSDETHTETEKAFRLQFVTGSSAIIAALEAVSGVILLIMALILGNTLAMGLRERTSELGALRAIGFLPKHIHFLGLFEGAALGLLGGAVGVAVSSPLLKGLGRALANMGFLAGVTFRPDTALLTLLCAGLIGALASALPTWSAARMDVVAALRRQE